MADGGEGLGHLFDFLSKCPPGEYDCDNLWNDPTAVTEQLRAVKAEVQEHKGRDKIDPGSDEVLEQTGWFGTLAKKCVDQNFDSSNVKCDVVGPLIRGLVSPLSLSHACCKHVPY